jgi:protein associated with RNAse G/E
LPKIISDQSNPVLYADDTSLVITNSNSQIFEKDKNTVISRLNRWFHSNSLLLNLGKTHFLQFVTKNTKTLDLQILHQNKHISSVNTIKFLGLMIDDKLSWHTPTF